MVRICAERGCHALVRDGYRCRAHALRPWDHGGRSRQERGYGAEHERLRRIVLEEEPVCHYCRERPSTTVDHRVPISRGGPTVRDNLVGCCSDCQARKASREGNAARKGRAGTGLPPGSAGSGPGLHLDFSPPETGAFEK
jgi:5-methylcytosine-specific restriction protein A